MFLIFSEIVARGLVNGVQTCSSTVCAEVMWAEHSRNGFYGMGDIRRLKEPRLSWILFMPNSTTFLAASTTRSITTTALALLNLASTHSPIFAEETCLPTPVPPLQTPLLPHPSRRARGPPPRPPNQNTISRTIRTDSTIIASLTLPSSRRRPIAFRTPRVRFRGSAVGTRSWSRKGRGR